MDEEQELKELLEQKRIIDQKIKAIKEREINVGVVKYFIRQSGIGTRHCVSVRNTNQKRWNEIINEESYKDAKHWLKGIIEQLNDLYKQM